MTKMTTKERAKKAARARWGRKVSCACPTCKMIAAYRTQPEGFSDQTIVLVNDEACGAWFLVRAGDHLSGVGCPVCSDTHGKSVQVDVAE